MTGQFVEGLDGVYRSRLPIANVGLQMVNRCETRSLCHATAPACAFAHWAHPRAERRRCQGSHRSWSLLQRMHKVLVVVVLHDTQGIQSALRQVRSVNQVLVHAREKPGWSCLDGHWHDGHEASSA